MPCSDRPGGDTLAGPMLNTGLDARRGSAARFAAGLAIAAAGLALLASPAAAKTPIVHINGDSFGNYKFTPPTVEIKRRHAVRWEWDSNAAHNVTFRKLDKSSKTGASEHYRLTFKKKGTFKYLCTLHDFHGKVVVK
jgi:plastocyanin